MENDLTNNNSFLDNYKSLKIKDINEIEGYYLLAFDNGQKILMKDKEIYDISGYNVCNRIIELNNRKYGVLRKHYRVFLVDLETKEVIYEKDDCQFIYKVDERVIIANYHNRETFKDEEELFDIQKKKLITPPPGYTYEVSYGNGLYIFAEKVDFDKEVNFHDRNRVIKNLDNEVVMDNIRGWVYLYQDNLVVIQKEAISIMSLHNDSKLKVNTLTINENVIGMPQYLEKTGEIVLVLKNSIEKYDINLNLIKTINLPELEKYGEVLDTDVIGNVFKLLLPYKQNEKQINRHFFINLDTEKALSHLRIEQYEYWNPTIFVGQDELIADFNAQEQIFSFYDKDFNLIRKIPGICVNSLTYGDELLFEIPQDERVIIKDKDYDRTWLYRKVKLYNAMTNTLIDSPCQEHNFNVDSDYGYGLNFENDTVTVFDKQFRVVMEDFPYRKYDLNLKDQTSFHIAALNGYVIITKHIAQMAKSYYRKIVINPQKEVVLDTYDYIKLVLNYIVITDRYDHTRFLNTLTSQFENLGVNAPLINGKVDFENKDNRPIFVVNGEEAALLEEGPIRNLKLK